jgi:signal peptidase II
MRTRLAFFFTAIIWLFLDQITKGFVSDKLALGETLPVWQDFFHITYILNTGASFGILRNQIWLFVILTVLVLLLIIWMIWQEPRLSVWQLILLGLVSGGALGNLLDRLKQGAVIDFIDFRGIWPYIFNVADIGVIVGGLLFLVLYLRKEYLREKMHESNQ